MKKILVVDDVHAIAEATAALLGMFGHEVRTAHDGREAVDAVRDEHPDVVLLDLNMPVLDGFEAAREIRQSNPSLPPVLVAVSAVAHFCTNDRLQSCGFDHCVTKPADIERLLEIIEQA